MKFNFDNWVRQPSTLTGLATAAAGIGAALAHVMTGNPKVDAAIAFVSFVLVHLAIDDNSAAGVAVKAVAADVAHIASGKSVDPTKVVADVVNVADAAKPAA